MITNNHGIYKDSEVVKQVKHKALEITEESLSNITTISHHNVRTLAQLCKYSFLTNENNRIIQKIDEVSYHLVQNKIWEDLVHCNYPFILDYLYISRNAIRYANVHNTDINKGLKSVIDVINGPYLLNAEWTSNDLIELYAISNELNISFRLPLNLELDSLKYIKSVDQTWQWTDENYKAFKEYSLVVPRLQKEDMEYSRNKVISLSSKLLVAAVSNRDITKISDLLLIYSVLRMPGSDLTNCAWRLLSQEQLTASTALSLMVAADYFKNHRTER